MQSLDNRLTDFGKIWYGDAYYAAHCNNFKFKIADGGHLKNKLEMHVKA